METTKTVKKQSNRAIQQKHATYKSKSEIAEALHLLEHSELINLSPTTMKVLKHFAYTKGAGSTQIKIRELCYKVGISKSAYYDTANPEIKGYFKEPLIITINMTKIDKLGRINPNGSKIKVLQPLWKIKQLIEQKQSEILKEQAQFMEQFKEDEKHQNGHTGGHTGGHTHESATPCGSKGESAFLNKQNKSFRENPLEKDIYNIYNTSPRHAIADNQPNNGENVRIFSNEENVITENQPNNDEKVLISSNKQKAPKIDMSIVDSKTFDFLNSYPKFVNYKFWDIDLKNEMAFWIQRAINKVNADINNRNHQNKIKKAVGSVMSWYNNDKTKEELTKLMYSSVKKELEQIITAEMEVASTIEIAVTGERPKKKAFKPKRKIIRTELISEELESAIERDKKRYEEKLKQEQAEREEKLKDPNFLANLKASILSKYGNSQQQAVLGGI